MNKIQTFFNQPYPISKKPWIIVLVSSVLVFFILGLFQPFGLSNVSSARKWPVIAGFACITAISTGIVGYLFPILFKRFYNPDKWTNGKNLLNNALIILVIGLGNFAFDWSFTNRSLETFIPLLSTYLLITFLVGIIPMALIAIIIQNRSLNQNLHDAREMNNHLLESLQKTHQPLPRESTLVLLSGNTKDEIELYPEDILYIEASGNYVHIHYKTGTDTIKQKQLRATIGQMENELEAFPFIIKCHRAFLVNTSYIVNVEGNSQGFLLSLRHTKNLVPVSRTYTKHLRNVVEM